MKRLLLLAFLIPSLSSALTIQGAVVKGAGKTPVAGQAIQVHVVRGDQEEKGATFTTGPDGRYRFDGLKQDPGLAYYVSTEYENSRSSGPCRRPTIGERNTAQHTIQPASSN